MLSVGKARGPVKLSFGAVCLLWEWERQSIVDIAKAVVPTGQHPAVWKRATGVVICKARMAAYTKLKAYRTISPQSCMLKVVERVVVELVAD